MSYVNYKRGSTSHLPEKHRLKNRLPKFASRLIVLVLALILVALLIRLNGELSSLQRQLSQERSGQPVSGQETLSPPATELEPPPNVPTTAETIPVSTSLPIATTVPTTTEAPTTTTTEPPKPVLADVGTAANPADPIRVTMSFATTSEPDADGEVSMLTCHGEAELQLIIPVSEQVLTVDAAEKTYRVETKGARYQAAALSLAPCMANLPIEGGRSEVKDAGAMFKLHQEDGHRTAAANQLLMDLAMTTVCVNQADINLGKSAHRLLKDAFLKANPFLEASSVTAKANQPEATTKAVNLPVEGWQPLRLLAVKCERNG